MSNNHSNWKISENFVQINQRNKNIIEDRHTCSGKFNHMLQRMIWSTTVYILKQSFTQFITLLMMWRLLHNQLNYLRLHMRSNTSVCHKNDEKKIFVKHSNHCSYCARDSIYFHGKSWEKTLRPFVATRTVVNCIEK